MLTIQVEITIHVAGAVHDADPDSCLVEAVMNCADNNTGSYPCSI